MPRKQMCPHCGAMVWTRRGLTTDHDACPGSGQTPRCAESDRRPLWNGQPNLRFAGAAPEGEKP